MDALSLWGRYGGRAGTSGGQATSGYARGVWVSVPPYGITLSETVLLVDETHVDLRTVGNGGQVTSAVGADIRFEEESTSVEMPREILHYDGISGRVVAADARRRDPGGGGRGDRHARCHHAPPSADAVRVIRCGGR